MKKILLVILTISLFSCSQDEPQMLKMSENTAHISIKSSTPYVLMVSYMDKNSWKQETKILSNTIINGDYEVSLDINREQNFAYFLQKRDPRDKSTVTGTLTYKGYSNSRSFTGDGILWDIYEFYPQSKVE